MSALAALPLDASYEPAGAADDLAVQAVVMLQASSFGSALSSSLAQVLHSLPSCLPLA